MDHNECMLTLERLMDEFFHHSTSNERKREIEFEFQTLKTTPGAWHLFTHFIKHSSSHYVIMFSLSVLASVISKMDKGDAIIREETRKSIQTYLFMSGIRAPHYLREKYAKLLVHIAIEDWPETYPEFITVLVELLQFTENRLLIGLIVLRTTSEEFTSEYAVPDKGKREKLTALMEPHIPMFFGILTKALESLDNKPRHTATATPPPSPTHNCAAMEPMGANLVEPMDPYAPDSKALNREILKTLQHFFSWVPISTITPDLIKCIFNIMNISSYSQEDMDLCMLALSTINEILYRKCSPPGTENIFIQIYLHTVDLLRDLSTSSMYQLESIDSTFVQKLSEMLVLLIQQHFWKFEMHSNVSALEFLSSFYQLTVQLPSIQCYYQCLNTWSAFVKLIKPNKRQRYSEVLGSLISMITKKFQYTTNFEQLKGVNTQELNEDNETEWGLLIKTSNELLASITDIMCGAPFLNVHVQWLNLYENYMIVLREISNQNNLANMISSEEKGRLYCTLTDFATLTQTLGRLSFQFLDGLFSDSYEEKIDDLYKKLLLSAAAANATKLSNFSLDPKIMESLDMAHSEVLGSLRTWLFWGFQEDHLKMENLTRLLDVALNVFFAPHMSSECVACSAACLLHSLSAKVPTQNLLEFNNLLSFIDNSCISRHPSVKVRQLIDECICNVLLSDGTKPKPDGEYMWELRSQRMYSYIENLTKEFRSLVPTTEEEKVKRVSVSTLDSLSHIVDYCKKFSTPSKKTIYLCLQDTIQHSLRLFPTFVKCPEVGQTILTFFVNVIGVLQAQMGLEGTKVALDMFLKVAIQNVDMAYVEKLLQIMKLVVEVPGSAYRTLLPAIVELCLQNLQPMVMSQSKDHPEVYLALLQLLYSLLAHQWQYFHQSAVSAGFSPCVDTERQADGPQKPQELITILEIFGQALLQEDLNILKFSIGALEDLNQKWNLYIKEIFREYLLIKFLTVLLSALMNKAYSLLSEDVQIAIYNMAFRNFEIFFQTFLPQFISSLEGITPTQGQNLLRNFQRESDMPSFINQLKVFVARAQTLCNS